jgi:hypothetical protein
MARSDGLVLVVAVVQVKDRDKFLAGLMLKLSVGVLVGVVWLNQAKDKTQASIFPTTGEYAGWLAGEIRWRIRTCI